MKIVSLVASLIMSAILLVLAYAAYFGAAAAYEDEQKRILFLLVAYGLPILAVIFTVHAIKGFRSKP